MKMIVGLGNPGKEYLNTRHNLGFRVVDGFAEFLNIKIKKEKFNGIYEITCVNNEKVLLLKPLSFMNLSGKVVRDFADYFDIDVDDILVISDDLNLPFLNMRLRLFGSSGGHNGLKDIEKCLGTNKFKRFRIGISYDSNVDVVKYVLGNFTFDERLMIDKFLFKSNCVLSDFLVYDFNKLMSMYN